MKINADLSEIVPNRGSTYFQTRKTPSAGMTPPANLNLSEGGSTASAASNIGVERRISQALTIAINASALINKALYAASRLRAMAHEALTQGGVDYREMTENLAGIRSSLSEVGVGYTTPAITSYATPDGAKLPPIRDEIAAFAKAADAMKAPSEEIVRSIDAGITSLQGKQATVDAVVSASRGGTGAGNFADMMKTVASGIVQDPAAALAAQGNINPDKVTGLFA